MVDTTKVAYVGVIQMAIPKEDPVEELRILRQEQAYYHHYRLIHQLL